MEDADPRYYGVYLQWLVQYISNWWIEYSSVVGYYRLAITIYSFSKIACQLCSQPASSITGRFRIYILSTSNTARCGQTYYSQFPVYLYIVFKCRQRFNKHRGRVAFWMLVDEILCSYLVLALSTQSDNLECSTN